MPDGAIHGEILGLAHQMVWARKERVRKKRRLLKALKKRRLATARSKQRQPGRSRRGGGPKRQWEETIAAIGRCPQGKRWISIGDRGADVFTHFEKCLQD